MSKQTSHAHLLKLPFHESLAGGYLDAFRQEKQGKCIDLIMDFHELQLNAPSKLFNRYGSPWEQIQGSYNPRCLRFISAEFIQGEKLCTRLTWSPDGNYLAYNTATPEDQISIIDTKTGRVRDLLNMAGSPKAGYIAGPPAWQP